MRISRTFPYRQSFIWADWFAYPNPTHPYLCRPAGYSCETSFRRSIPPAGNLVSEQIGNLGGPIWSFSRHCFKRNRRLLSDSLHCFGFNSLGILRFCRQNFIQFIVNRIMVYKWNYCLTCPDQPFP